MIFDLPGHDSLQRIPTMEPLRGTAEHVGELFETSKTAADLFAAITARVAPRDHPVGASVAI